MLMSSKKMNKIKRKERRKEYFDIELHLEVKCGSPRRKNDGGL